MRSARSRRDRRIYGFELGSFEMAFPEVSKEFGLTP